MKPLGHRPVGALLARLAAIGLRGTDGLAALHEAAPDADSANPVVQDTPSAGGLGDTGTRAGPSQSRRDPGLTGAMQVGLGCGSALCAIPPSFCPGNSRRPIARRRWNWAPRHRQCRASGNPGRQLGATGGYPNGDGLVTRSASPIPSYGERDIRRGADDLRANGANAPKSASTRRLNHFIDGRCHRPVRKMRRRTIRVFLVRERPVYGRSHRHLDARQRATHLFIGGHTASGKRPVDIPLCGRRQRTGRTNTNFARLFFPKPWSGYPVRDRTQTNCLGGV